MSNDLRSRKAKRTFLTTRNFTTQSNEMLETLQRIGEKSAKLFQGDYIVAGCVLNSDRHVIHCREVPVPRRAMGNYFKPWRRKTGVATLALACVVMGVWLKSDVNYGGYFLGYFLDIPQEPVLYAALTSPHGFVWTRQEDINNTGAKKILRFKWYANAYVIEPEELDLHRTDLQDHQVWYWCGFIIHNGNYAGGRVLVKTWTAPFWSVVIPLALISAWLLLSKTRVARSAPVG